MSYARPMSWLHEEPERAIAEQMQLDASSHVTNVLGIGPSMAYKLEETYSITSIKDLIGCIMYNGYPRDIEFKEETKFVISLLISKFH